VAQEQSERPLQVVKLPDLKNMTDQEIDEYAKTLWAKFAAEEPSSSPSSQDSDLS
jgi:hypothetical protein